MVLALTGLMRAEAAAKHSAGVEMCIEPQVELALVVNPVMILFVRVVPAQGVVRVGGGLGLGLCRNHEKWWCPVLEVIVNPAGPWLHR